MIYPKLLNGDIVGVRGRGILRFLSEHLTKPKTDRVHFLVIGDYIKRDNDYVILESINKGIAVGRLSFYQPEEIEIYRRVLPKEQEYVRRWVTEDLTLIGRCGYDWFLYIKLFMGMLNLIAHGKFPPYDPQELPYGRDNSYLCTEAARYGWLKEGLPIIEKDVVPTPAGYKKALNEGILEKVYPVEMP